MRNASKYQWAEEDIELEPTVQKANSGGGVMIGYFLPEELAEKLVIDGGEEAEELHLTLFYFGDAENYSEREIENLKSIVAQCARNYAPLQGEIGGVARFPAGASSDNMDVLLRLVDVPRLEGFRERLLTKLESSQLPPRKDHGYTAHVTLAYVGQDWEGDNEHPEPLPLVIDNLVLAVGGERFVYPLNGETVLKNNPCHVPGGSPKGGQFCSTGGGSGFPSSPDAEFVADLRKDLQKRYNAKTDNRPIVSALAFRESDPTNLAMAQYVEKQAGREAMLTALNSQMEWNTGWNTAGHEWKASQSLGASSSSNRVAASAAKEVSISPDAAKAFQARTEFVQNWVSKQHGEDIVVYRGIKGKQAKTIKESGSDEVDLGVYGLSSFTTSASKAKEFAGKSGLVLESKIRPRDVFNANEIGVKGITRFSDDHGELVVMTSGSSRKARVLND